MKNLLRNVARTTVEQLAGTRILRDEEKVLVRDAQIYWQDSYSKNHRSNSHWCGDTGIDDTIWRELGKRHLDLFRNYLALKRLNRPTHRIVEWGCGGGANAIHFATEGEEFVGVDVSSNSLTECGRRLQDMGFFNYLPIQITVDNPDKAVEHLIGTCDVFLCTYVFELFPTPEYGQRIVNLAYRLLRPSGFAIIQIKYGTHERRTRPRRWSYERNLANMTTYTIEDFWLIAEQAGFSPFSVTLRPKDELVGDERYAYFLLEKK